VALFFHKNISTAAKGFYFILTFYFCCLFYYSISNFCFSFASINKKIQKNEAFFQFYLTSKAINVKKKTAC